MAKGLCRTPFSENRPPGSEIPGVQWKETPAPSPDVLKASAKPKPEDPSKVFFPDQSASPMDDALLQKQAHLCFA